MAVTEHDVEQFAARIRLHFELELRDIAFDLAHAIARVVGSQVKLLRPDTKIAEIFAWVPESDSGSLDQVEWIMAIEMEFGFELPDEELPDELAGRFDRATLGGCARCMRYMPASRLKARRRRLLGCPRPEDLVEFRL